MDIDWNKLKDEANEAQAFQFSPPSHEELPTRVAWKDRFLEAFLSGSIPLALLSVSLLSWMVDGSYGLAVLLMSAPILAWFSQPFSRLRGLWSPWMGVLLYLPLVLGSALLMLLPTSAVYFSQSLPLHPELFAWVLQRNLESVLQWEPLLGYLGSLGVLGMMASKLQSNSPWLEPQRDSSLSLGWRILCLLGLVASGFWFQAQSKLTAKELQWRDEMEAFYQSRPTQSLPFRTSENHWRELFRKHREAGEDVVYQPTSLSEHPPASQVEFEVATYYLFYSLPYELEPFTKANTMLDKVQISLLERPTGNWSYLRVVLYKLALLLKDASLSPEELQHLRTRVVELQEELFTRQRELDTGAYLELWVQTQENENTIGWETYGESFSWLPHKRKQLMYKGTARPENLRAFGLEFTNSPTRVLKDYQQLSLTRQWLGLREEILQLPLEKQLQKLIELRDQLGHLDSREQQFWNSQYHENRVGKELELLEGLEQLLTLRLESSDRQLPVPFESLFSEPEESPKMYGPSVPSDEELKAAFPNFNRGRK